MVVAESINQALGDRACAPATASRATKPRARLSASRRPWAEFSDHPTEAVLERIAEEDDFIVVTIHKLRTVSFPSRHLIKPTAIRLRSGSRSGWHCFQRRMRDFDGLAWR